MNERFLQPVMELSANELVTKTKLHGSMMMLDGETTPERWPFVILIAVGGPGNEAVVAVLEKARREIAELAELALDVRQ